MFRVAVYGKGGIGKSTIASNLSYILSQRGLRVCHIGCDPKHDSTRSLINGRHQETALDVIRRKGDGTVLGDLVFEGINGIDCIEVGGPEPGIGCAGRGMITVFDRLYRLGFRYEDYDVVVSDVLGDVVCGGFAIPLRSKNSDAVFIVTSGEFMPLYAANNLLKGVSNFSHGRKRVAGIVFNSRGEDEDAKVTAFAEAVHLPVSARLERDELFEKAEAAAEPLARMFPDSESASVLSCLADRVEELMSDRTKLFPARPLDEDRLEGLLYNRPVDGVVEVHNGDRCGFNPENERSMMRVCATKGSIVMVLSRVRDLTILVHGPRSCGHMINTAVIGHDLSVFTDEGDRKVLPDRVHCTCMDEMSSVYGGMSDLEESLERLLSLGERNIAVVTTCVSGMLGDNIGSAVESAKARYPDAIILSIPADGAMSGDGGDGRLTSVTELLGLIRSDRVPDMKRMAVFDEFYHSQDTDRNRRSLTELAETFSLDIGLRMFDKCCMEDIQDAGSNGIVLMMRDTDNNRIMRSLLETKGIHVHNHPFPKGMRSTATWLDGFVSEYGLDRSAADSYISRYRSEYERSLSGCSGKFAGRKYAIYHSSQNDAGWVIEVLSDLGMVCADDITVVDSNSPMLQEGSGRFVDMRGLTKVLDGSDDILVIGDAGLPKVRDQIVTVNFNEYFCLPSVEFINRLSETVERKPMGWKKWKN